MKNNKNVKHFCSCNRCERHAKQRANKKKLILFSLGVVAGAVVTCYALRNRQELESLARTYGSELKKTGEQKADELRKLSHNFTEKAQKQVENLRK